MRKLRRILIFAGVVVLVLAIVVGGLGIWFVRRPWPKVSGTISLSGLSSPVEILRDRSGVPHIFAATEHDLLFAQGYVHAQDRLWQMEFNRRIGTGTLSAILGESALEIDRFMRVVGLRRAAEEDWALVDDEVRLLMEAYCDGVNAFVETHRDRLPLEFTILGVKPTPWTPIDSLTWGKVMAYNLGGNFRNELFRARLIANLGEAAASELLPPYPENAPFIIPPEVKGYASLKNVSLSGLDALTSILGDAEQTWGSNSWVVHGSRTTTGMPLLANDMHLGLNMPSIWYENGLHGGRFEVVGFSFPGVPMVIVGHNSRIAWGDTSMMPDVQDLYIERLDDATSPTRYEYMGDWHDLQVLREVIEVKGDEPIVLDVLITHHGPIMNDALGLPEGSEPVALQWTALRGTQLFRSVLLLNLAGNWDEFRTALSFWDVASQNFTYADIDGNIGYQSTGIIPIRAPQHRGLVPVPGWAGDYEWQGTIPFEDLPSVLNPERGFLATANNKVVPDDYPYHLAYEYAAGYRAQRITELLSADDQISPEDMQALHAQTYSVPAEALLPYLLALEPEDELQSQVLARIRAWDLHLEADSVGAAIYEVWVWYLVHNTLGDELGDDVFMNLRMMTDLMEDERSEWFDDVETNVVENRDDIVRRSFADAVHWLAEHCGDNPAKWQWGQLHSMTFVHQPLGQSGIGLLEKLFNSRTIPARGDAYTVDAAAFAFGAPFATIHGASQRYIADLSSLEDSLSIHTTGQSGHLFHRHREDFAQMWQNVEYHPMRFGRAAAEADREALLVLSPP